jgi:hypothetical protein
LRNQIATDRTIRQEVLDTYIAMRRLGVDHELRRDVWQRLDSLTLDDVVHFHAAEFAGRPFTMAVMGSRSRIDMKALARHGKVVEVSLEELFGY